MDPRDEMDPIQLEILAQAFCGQLMACLDECARGRRGLFSDVELLSEEGRWDLSQMDDSTVAQLCAPRWAPDSSGRIKVERKDDTK